MADSLSGTARIQCGEYKLDETAWFDVRLTDAGLAISCCDVDMNVRYTALIDNGRVVMSEVTELITE